MPTATAAPLLDPGVIPQVPLPFMNADHAEEARLLNAVAAAIAALESGEGDRAAVVTGLEALYEHTAAHFAREEEAMVRTGFFAYARHRAEHQRVLAALGAEASNFAATGDLARLKAYALEAVPVWFFMHIETMDSVTARFVASNGG